MGDMVPECKKKLARFRIQELKDVLGQLGLAKTGRKQDLMDRILALLSRDEGSDIHGLPKKKYIAKKDVAKIIDETYRKMQHTAATDPGTGGHCVSDSSSITPIVDQKIQCPCGSTVKTEFMIQCADPECHVLQHIPCVVIPEESVEGIPPSPCQFYCELCRINRSDPFCKTLGHPLYPIKLRVTSIPEDGSKPLQNVETNFEITRADVHLLESTGCDVQAWCILLNDRVPFRMQWPQYPDLKVNGIPVKTINRPGSKMLGANGRDDGSSISVYLVEGHNKISLSCSDARTFCIGVRLVIRHTVQQVINLIPSEQEGVSFTEAVARVCRCIGGGMVAANEDSDSDLEVVADNVTINLRCPMSGSRMKTAARFKGCVHLGCFDLNTFIQINERSRKWQCPICLKNYSLEDIVIDPYLNRVVKMMQACDEDVTEIEVKSDGSWRAKIGHPFMDLEHWHLPDGSLCISAVKGYSSIEVPAETRKRESTICDSAYGIFNVDIPQDMHGQLIISKSSASSANMKDDALESINHCGTSQYDITSNKDSAMDSTPYNYNPESGITNRSTSSSLGDPGVIVLSDSEEENDTVAPSGGSITCPPNGGSSLLAAHPEPHVTHLEDESSRPVESAKAHSSQTCDSESSGSPFTFRRQARTVRKQHVMKDIEGD